MMQFSKIYWVIGLCFTTLLSPFAKANTLVCQPQIYGGRGGGMLLNTKAIQTAIDVCAQQGGGIVSLTKGVWLSGPLSLKSNITLHLDQGAVLRASNIHHEFASAFIDQPAQKGEAFILADHVHDVHIVGNGTIDGDGQQTWWVKAKQVNTMIHQGKEKIFEKEFPGIPFANGMPRPWLIELNYVQNASIKGVLLTNSPMWNLVLRNSQNIQVTQIKVKNPKDSPNTDGIDGVSSQHIFISNVDISTGDDNISIKSGLAQNTNPSSSDVVIKESIMRDGHGISIGSETANGIGKTTIQHIRFFGTTNGLRIKSQRDQGNMIGPIFARYILMENVKNPIIITSSYNVVKNQKQSFTKVLQKEKITPLTPLIHDISLRDIKAIGADHSVILSGLPEALIQNLILDRLFIQANHGLQARYVQGTMNQVKIQTGKKDDSDLLGPEVHLKQHD